MTERHYSRLGLHSWFSGLLRWYNAQALSQKSCNLNYDTYIGICHWCAIIHCDAVRYFILTRWEACCDCACYYNNFTACWIWTGNVCWGLRSRDVRARTHRQINEKAQIYAESDGRVQYPHRCFVTSLLMTGGRLVLCFFFPLSCSLS